TTCLPPARPCRLAPAPCSAAAPRTSMCWYSPGLLPKSTLPYNGKPAKQRTRHAARRNLYHPLLPLLPLGKGAAQAQGRGLQGNRSGRQLGAARRDDRPRRRPRHGSADFHRQRACRRQRRSARAGTRRQARRFARWRGASRMNEATFKAAMIQMRSGLTPSANIDDAVRLIGEAKVAGANYVQTPEMTNILAARREQLFTAIIE